jgi:hypothetical protein
VSEILSINPIQTGAVIAAFISGYWSFVNLIVSKDQKVSEFRQCWIDKLREDIAKFTSHVLSFQTAWMAYKHLNANEKEHGAKFLIEKNSDIKELTELSNRIRLRLNPTENEDLITLLDDIDRYITSPSNLRDGDDVIRTANHFIIDSQKLLKNEWNRVKSGEKGFRYTRNMSALLIFTVIIYALFSWLYVKYSG